MRSSDTRQLVILHFVVVICCRYCHATQQGNINLDEIIEQMKYFRSELKTYECEYEYSEYRVESTNKYRPQPGMEYNTTGTFLVDRESEFYLNKKDKSPMWNASEKQWQFAKVTASEYNDRRITLNQNWEGVDGGKPLAILRTIRNNEDRPKNAGFVGTEEYFRHGGLYIDEYLSKYKEYISDVTIVDEFRIKVSMQNSNEQLKGYWEELVLDSRYGWNLVESSGFDPNGRMGYRKKVSYESVGGIYLMSDALYEEYNNKDSLEPTKQVNVKVEIESAKVNKTYSKDAYFVPIPPGTYVQDHILKTNYVIPDGMEGFEIATEPALEMLSSNYKKSEVETLTTKEISTKDRGTSKDIGRQRLVEIPSEKKEMEQAMAEKPTHILYYFLLSFVFIICAFLFIRRTTTGIKP